MTERIEEVLATLDGFRMSDEMTYSAYSALYDQISLLDDLLKEQENCVSIPFSWLVKFCTHIDFREPMSDKERAERWREKLKMQFGIEVRKET